MIKAVIDCDGNLTAAAKYLQVARSTIYRRSEKNRKLAKAMDESKESMLDVAEGKLHEAVRAGDAWAICFYLKTQGKRRGYVERQEIQPVQIEMIYEDADEDKKTNQG